MKARSKARSAARLAAVQALYQLDMEATAMAQFNGRRLNGKKPFEINRMGLSRSFQITNIFPKLSVFENLRCGVLWSLGYKYTFLKFLADLTDANDRANELMQMVKLDKKRDILAMNLTYADLC